MEKAKPDGSFAQAVNEPLAQLMQTVKKRYPDTFGDVI